MCSTLHFLEGSREILNLDVFRIYNSLHLAELRTSHISCSCIHCQSSNNLFANFPSNLCIIEVIA